MQGYNGFGMELVFIGGPREGTIFSTGGRWKRVATSVPEKAGRVGLEFCSYFSQDINNH
jgi:hypothetical protein